jgi:hypothetical protein
VDFALLGLSGFNPPIEFVCLFLTQLNLRRTSAHAAK